MKPRSRTPPVEMRRSLRKEVNYGCPICRSPFLTWHHFDPPWQEYNSEVHVKEGIIALCSNCHRQAEGGAYTKTYFHELKSINIKEPPLGSLPWHINNALIKFGGNFFLTGSDQEFSIRVAHNEVFSLRSDKNDYLILNASIWDSKDALVLRIKENDIVSYLENISDLECTAHAKKLTVVSKENDARFSLEFNRSNPDDTIPNSSKLFPKTFIEKTPDIASYIDNDIRQRSEVLIDVDGLVPTIEMDIAVHGPGFKIDTTNKGIVFDMTGLGYDQAIMTGKFFGEHALTLNYGNKKDGYRELVHLGSE